MDFATHSFAGDDTEYITPTWQELHQLTFDIAQQIQRAGKAFDRIVTLAKGGWPMTRCLVDFLDTHEVASIGVKFYAGINERLTRPRIYQDLPVSVEGERVLLFDDVADTGASLKFTHDYLTHYRGVEDVATASLLTKPHSVLRPDFSGADTSAWIIFPYDAAEMIAVLGVRWAERGVPPQEVRERFLTLGFSADWIDRYAQSAS
jgi:hypoxanthine phosphoribosyltransferase